VNKWSEIEKSYSGCGPSFSKEPKALKTLPLEELETILSTWFKQAHTAKASTDGLHLKEKALHVAALLGINSFWASSGSFDCFKKTQPGIQDYVRRKCHCKSQNSDGLEK